MGKRIFTGIIAVILIFASFAFCDTGDCTVTADLTKAQEVPDDKPEEEPKKPSAPDAPADDRKKKEDKKEDRPEEKPFEYLYVPVIEYVTVPAEGSSPQQEISVPDETELDDGFVPGAGEFPEAAGDERKEVEKAGRSIWVFDAVGAMRLDLLYMILLMLLLLILIITIWIIGRSAEKKRKENEE